MLMKPTDTEGRLLDVDMLELNGSIASILVAPRFLIFTIFIISLAKWFRRELFPLVFVSLTKTLNALGSMDHE